MAEGVVLVDTSSLWPYCSIQLAYAVDHDSYGLIFGFNTFLSLVIMTVFTLTVADEHGLDLDIRSQVWAIHYYISIYYILHSSPSLPYSVHTCHSLLSQFVVYSGYYCMLALLFVGAGVYSLTATGWLNSLRFCCSEPRPPSLAGRDENEDATTIEGPTETSPMIQERGRAGPILSKAAVLI